MPDQLTPATFESYVGTPFAVQVGDGVSLVGSGDGMWGRTSPFSAWQPEPRYRLW
ncbi:MAG: hypothetical protein ABI706_08535 [Ilumatobacteraceae bacterium]